ncbi:hypothetical protein CP975_03910 [Streptomyces alboniger]|uniref:Carrier domain-containing protein n=1 Tax=Streptomyces alboniger TaxID=132473 RepID=A0A5J6HHV9_STRAD|nr:hypothetical protein CP975_03910 [Streptomyces alboniger]
MAEQGVQAVRDQPHRRFVPRGDDLSTRGDRLAQRYGTLSPRATVGQGADDAGTAVLGRTAQHLGEDPDEVGAGPGDARPGSGIGGLLRLGAPHEEFRDLLEAALVSRWQAQHLREHRGRQRSREVGDDVRLTSSPGLVDQLGDTLFRPGTELVGGPGGEGVADLAPLAVVSGRVGEQEGARGHAVARDVASRGCPVPEPWITQHGGALGVTEEHQRTRGKSVDGAVPAAQAFSEVVRVVAIGLTENIEGCLLRDAVGPGDRDGGGARVLHSEDSRGCSPAPVVITGPWLPPGSRSDSPHRGDCRRPEGVFGRRAPTRPVPRWPPHDPHDHRKADVTTSEAPFTEESLKTIVVEQFEIPADRLAEDATLEALGLDSLGLLELLVAIEAQTHKEISTLDLPITPGMPYSEAARVVIQAVADAPVVGAGDLVPE